MRRRFAFHRDLGLQLFTDMTILENLKMGASNQHARPNFVRNLERVYNIFPRRKERSAPKSRHFLDANFVTAC